MRVYVGTTLTQLAEWVAAAQVPAGTAHAVTAGLREWYADGDDEELEYVALCLAARASLRELALAPTGTPLRRVVLALDVPDGDVTERDGDGRGSVRLAAVSPWRSVQAAHVDDAGAQTAVARAADEVLLADNGDEDAELAVGDAEEHELLWWATQEIPGLLA